MIWLPTKLRGPRGAKILPRHVADGASASWPKCVLCGRNVDAYGIENETDRSVEVWARCTGVRIDPESGRAVYGAPKVHDTMQSSVLIAKGPGWSQQRFTDIIRRQAFFAPPGEGSRALEQDLTPEGVH